MMRIDQAIRVLKYEKEFLGVTWEQLELLCRVESSALKLAALDAWDCLNAHDRWNLKFLEDK